MSAWGVASNCDLILFILDAHRQVGVDGLAQWGGARGVFVSSNRTFNRSPTFLRLSTTCPTCLPPFPPHQIQLPDPRVVRLVQNLSKEQLDLPPAVLVLNKCELVPREQRPALLTLADSLRQDHPFEETFWISALKGVWLPG